MFQKPIPFVQNNELNTCLFLETWRDYGKLKLFIKTSTSTLIIDTVKSINYNQHNHLKYFNAYSISKTNFLNYVYITNVISALEILFEKGSPDNVYEIINKQNGYYTDKQIAELLVKFYKKTTDYKKWINYINSPQRFNEHLYPHDNNRLLKLGWEIKISIEQSLKIISNTFDETHCKCDC